MHNKIVHNLFFALVVTLCIGVATFLTSLAEAATLTPCCSVPAADAASSQPLSEAGAPLLVMIDTLMSDSSAYSAADLDRQFALVMQTFATEEQAGITPATDSLRDAIEVSINQYMEDPSSEVHTTVLDRYSRLMTESRIATAAHH